MKKFLSVTLAVLMVVAISLPVFAANSPSRPIEDVVIEVIDKDGNDITDELRLEINEESRKAEEELTDEKIEELLGDDYNDNMVLGDVYDVIYTGNAYPVNVTVKQNVAKEDVVFVLTKIDGKWVVIEDAVVSDGRISFPLNEDSVIAFVYERIIPEDEGPITGNSIAFVAMVALVCLAGTVYSVKRTVA